MPIIDLDWESYAPTEKYSLDPKYILPFLRSLPQLCQPEAVKETWDISEKEKRIKVHNDSFDNKPMTVAINVNKRIALCYGCEQIEACKTRFTYLNLILIQPNGFHANSILIDHELRIYERFEPNTEADDIDVFETNLLIDELIKQTFEQLLPGYEYIEADILCTTGPQIIQKQLDRGGFCQAWSVYYIAIRLLNPDTNPEEIYLYMTSRSPEELLDQIQRVVTLIESH